MRTMNSGILTYFHNASYIEIILRFYICTWFSYLSSQHLLFRSICELICLFSLIYKYDGKSWVINRLSKIPDLLLKNLSFGISREIKYEYYKKQCAYFCLELPRFQLNSEYCG